MRLVSRNAHMITAGFQEMSSMSFGKELEKNKIRKIYNE